MKKLSVILLLLPLAVTGCIVAPDHGSGDRGWFGGNHNDDRDQHRDSHDDHDQH